MSDIPFIDLLGNELEAAARSQRARPRRRRTLVIAVAALAVVAISTAAIAATAFSPGEAASQSVACYSSAAPAGGVDIVWAGAQTPVQVCRAALRAQGEDATALVACASPTSIVAVVPGEGRSACARAGFGRLPASYAPQRRKVARLQTAILRLEGGADCIAPTRFVREVQHLLDTSGWSGWTAKLGNGTGSCGAVSGYGGAGPRNIAGALLPDSQVVLVTAGPSRTLAAALWGAASAARRIEDMSGARCMTLSGIAAAARDALLATGAGVTIHVGALPAGEQIMDARAARYSAGCPIVSDLVPASSDRVVVSVFQKA